jgi:hypothetical protein
MGLIFSSEAWLIFRAFTLSLVSDFMLIFAGVKEISNGVNDWMEESSITCLVFKLFWF